MIEFPNFHVPFVPSWCVEITWLEMLDLPDWDLNTIWGMFGRLHRTQQIRVVDDQIDKVRRIYGDGSLSAVAL